MKPRLRRWRGFWVCFTGDVGAIGLTPSDAYATWLEECACVPPPIPEWALVPHWGTCQ